ncbi:OsmC family protein [Marinobacterium jannaschii]|uniref:OsmC family protein n=1 Tax=Marinobacterium jannaschii TaxID=64970 RepID=UPI0004864A47|nr:OsmC family protein [Marinobacterium jannaschii]
MAANKTISVTATMGAGYAIHADIRDHQVAIDQPTAGGGTNEGPTPLEYFLFSLGGCIASIARIAASQQKIDLRAMQVTVSGDLDPAGLLGKATPNRAGFQEIRVTASIDCDLSAEAQAEFLDEVCLRCPLHDNIKLSTAVIHSLS